MKIEKHLSQSNNIPNDFEVKHLGGTLYELIENRNVVEVKTVEDETNYQSNLTIIRTNISNREEAVIAFIRLRYTQDDEFSLINKGILDNTNSRYLEYRNYVDWCKEQSYVYFA